MTLEEKAEKRTEEKYACNEKEIMPLEAIGYKKGYLAGSEPREKRIAELEEQIDKMKCCGNCKHCKYDENEESNEYCEKHQQIVNIAVQACGYWEFENWGK